MVINKNQTPNHDKHGNSLSQQLLANMIGGQGEKRHSENELKHSSDEVHMIKELLNNEKLIL